MRALEQRPLTNMKTTYITQDQEIEQQDRAGFIPVCQYVGDIQPNDIGYIVRKKRGKPVYHPSSGVWSQEIEVLERIALADPS